MYQKKKTDYEEITPSIYDTSAARERVIKNRKTRETTEIYARVGGFMYRKLKKKNCLFASSSYDATILRYYQMGRRSEEMKNETEIGEEGRNWSEPCY